MVTNPCKFQHAFIFRYVNQEKINKFVAETNHSLDAAKLLGSTFERYRQILIITNLPKFFCLQSKQKSQKYFPYWPISQAGISKTIEKNKMFIYYTMVCIICGNLSENHFVKSHSKQNYMKNH